MVILKTSRDTYSATDAAKDSITVNEFIELLKREDGNEKIIFSNDGGYTFGSINENKIG